jgi:hypothetical protein
MEWNEVAQMGNPTRSHLMKRLLKNLKRMQTQRRGVASQARRPMTPGEFERLMTSHWSHENKELGLCAAALHACQLSLIGRNDDICKFRVEDLKPYDAFIQFAVLARLVWSKNVTDERDAPPQVLIGAFDTRYCPLANLGLWLEYCYELNPTPNPFVFGVEGLDDPIRIKERMGNLLARIVNSPHFVKDKPGHLGTHSIRKMAASYAASNGCSKVSCAFNYLHIVIDPDY